MLKGLLLIVIFLAGSVLGGFVMHFLDAPLFDLDHINYQKLPFPDTNSNIYMTARAWGLTGDSEEVKFCAASIDISKPLEGDGCVRFFTDEAYYRRERPNILHIYAASSAIPKDEPDRLGQIKVQIHEVKSFDHFKDLEKDYEDQKLGMINIPY